MPFAPQEIIADVAQGLGFGSNQTQTFQANQTPNISGFQTRQSQIPNNRPAYSTRKMVHWLVPEGPIVQMYVNPQGIDYSEKKTISNQRTKGGFTLQYWGEDLGSLSINGTTGTSGIEGINVLRDVYRNEQLAIDPYALLLAQRRDQENLNIIGSNTTNAILDDLGQLLLSSASGGDIIQSRPLPSLASLAFTVEMYWSGEVFRGFFENFSVKESSSNLGMFDYSFTFTFTQRRGFRQNFLAWHRSATDGPSNSNPITGVPYSFGPLTGGQAQPPPLSGTNLSDIVSSGAGLIQNSVTSIFNSLF